MIQIDSAVQGSSELYGRRMNCKSEEAARGRRRRRRRRRRKIRQKKTGEIVGRWGAVLARLGKVDAKHTTKTYERR
jgi:hypothetical protein